MTDLLDKAVEAVRRMPPDTQETIAQAMLDLAGLGATVEIDPDDLQDVLAGLDEIARGDIATDEEVKSAFRQFEP
ncbi:hypothetical protein [Methylobacterium sp. J-070]|uniref:hypothetical protein n=1 Tax=Methylobacterium sp. J-070 TaxID=2836650 RepID=UPI001FB8A8C3|nr:hypothetical protein [Methylobacterium sp. J-070]MCJ2050800.1 hypothetical protein [Methylobacterium sp. J-070]